MNRRKRQRHTTTNDAGNPQTKKSKRTTFPSVTKIDSNRHSITSFEDLANEVIHDIFDYLAAYQIYQAFYNLNTRFQSLLPYVDVPIKINNSSFSKLQFQHYCTDFILPIQHRMKTLHLTDPFIIEYLFPIAENISIYSRLQTLHLENIESQYLEDLLHRLTDLPSLSSLTMYVGPNANKMNIYNRLFQLPVLKYCELSFKNDISSGSLPISTNMSSPIEHLITNDIYHLNEVVALLSYVPQLRYLSVTGEGIRILVLILLNNSTQLSFPLNYLRSNDIDPFMKKYSHQIKLFHFSMMCSQHNRHDETLEKSILSYLPYVKIFYLEYAKQILCAYTLEMYMSRFKVRRLDLLNMQQWFFAHEPMSEESLQQTFCSFKPHRKKYHTVRETLTWEKPVCHAENYLRSVRCVTIKNVNFVNYCLKSFPNATELNLTMHPYNRSTLLANDSFHRMIPLTHLTILTINYNYLYLNELVDMLLYTPHIHTLTVTSLDIGATEISSLRSSKNFRSVSKQNKIKRVTIYTYSLRTIKALIKLCPELQHLSLGTSLQPFEAVVRFLLPTTRKSPCHVSSLLLYIYMMTPISIEELKMIVESKKRPDDYLLKVSDDKLYLWWG